MNKRTLFIVVMVFIAVLIGGLWVVHRTGMGGKTASGQKAKKDIYQCSMHPNIISDKPGECPICGMKLTKVEEPSIQEQAAGAKEPAVPGHESFSLSTDRQQMIGVKTTRVERKPLNLEIRCVGRVAYDPDLYNAVAEYREALKYQQKVEVNSSDLPSPALSGHPLPQAGEGGGEGRERAQALVKAARLRLRVMGVTEEDLPQMLSESSDSTNLLLPGKSVWVYAQVYEYEADSVHAGQTATVTLPASRDRAYTGRVAAVDPILDPATRTLRMRIKVESPQENLRPESFVQVKIQVPLGRVLSVPEDAVLDTGERQLVFVKSGEGRFEPRAVKIGREAQGEYEILSGLQEGEEIVTSANFLIDSESRFRSAVSSFGKQAAPKTEHAH